MQTAQTNPIVHSPTDPEPTPGDDPLHLLFTRMETAEEVAQNLRQYGFKCRTFVNGEVLRNAGRVQPPRALIVESAFLMASTENRAPSAKPSIPVICIADDDSLETRVGAIRGGADAFLVRPLNRFALLHAIERLIDPTETRQRRCLLLAQRSPLVEDANSRLRESGIAVSHLAETAALFSTLENLRPDLLLIHDDLGEFDSLELAQAVRQDPRHEGLPILLLTPRDKRLLDKRATAAGIDGLVGLPVNAQDLAAIIRARTRRAEAVVEAYRYLAKRDPVTGLFNRSYFMESLRHTLALAQLRPQCTGLIYVQLADDETWSRSPPMRDGLLTETAEILRRLLPPLAVAARIHDQGLAILVCSSADQDIELLATTLQGPLANVSVRIRGESACGQFQVGVTMLGRHQFDPEEAVARARRAATPGMDHGAAATLGTEESAQGTEEYWKPIIEDALAQNRFHLVYQPIASLSGHPTPFYEVFMRMRDSEGNDILPQQFLPAAQRCGLTGQLDRWVIARALHVLVEQKQGQHKPVLFVKLFGDTVSDSKFPGWLDAEIKTSGLAPERLVFEIAQRTITTRQSESVDLLRALNIIGCKVAVEHYGREGQTPAAVRDLTLDYLKLAGDMTADVGTNPETQKLVQRITSQARASGTRTIASLVQDATNLSALWRCGVEYIQGYFMQEPADVFAE